VALQVPRDLTPASFLVEQDPNKLLSPSTNSWRVLQFISTLVCAQERDTTPCSYRVLWKPSCWSLDAMCSRELQASAGIVSNPMLPVPGGLVGSWAHAQPSHWEEQLLVPTRGLAGNMERNLLSQSYSPLYTPIPSTGCFWLTLVSFQFFKYTEWPILPKNYRKLCILCSLPETMSVGLSSWLAPS
jgi:hypothetical protein